MYFPPRWQTSFLRSALRGMEEVCSVWTVSSHLSSCLLGATFKCWFKQVYIHFNLLWGVILGILHGLWVFCLKTLKWNNVRVSFKITRHQGNLSLRALWWFKGAKHVLWDLLGLKCHRLTSWMGIFMKCSSIMGKIEICDITLSLMCDKWTNQVESPTRAWI